MYHRAPHINPIRIQLKCRAGFLEPCSSMFDGGALPSLKCSFLFLAYAACIRGPSHVSVPEHDLGHHESYTDLHSPASNSAGSEVCAIAGDDQEDEEYPGGPLPEHWPDDWPQHMYLDCRYYSLGAVQVHEAACAGFRILTHIYALNAPHWWVTRTTRCRCSAPHHSSTAVSVLCAC